MLFHCTGQLAKLPMNVTQLAKLPMNVTHLFLLARHCYGFWRKSITPHRKIYSKVNLETAYPPSYSCKIWDTIDLIQTQLIALLKVLIGLTYFQIKICRNK